MERYVMLGLSLGLGIGILVCECSRVPKVEKAAYERGLFDGANTARFEERCYAVGGKAVTLNEKKKCVGTVTEWTIDMKAHQ